MQKINVVLLSRKKALDKDTSDSTIFKPFIQWGEWWLALKAVSLPFLLTRFIFILLTLFGVVLFNSTNYSVVVFSRHQLLFSWYRWDAIRFAKIALSGYPTLDFAAFFPLYPLLEHLGMLVTGKHPVIIGMVISNLAMLGMMVVLYRLVAIEYNRRIAYKTVLYQAIFPTAFFFFAAYNETLFLVFLLASFYAMRRRLWLTSAIWGFFAMLTRSIALILVLAFLYEFVRMEFPTIYQNWKGRQRLRSLQQSLPALWVLVIPLGLLLYAIYLNQSSLDDPLAFSHAQASWRMGLTFPLYAPAITIYNIVTTPLTTFFTLHNFLDFGALLLGIMLTILCFWGPNRLSRTQWVYAWYNAISLIYFMLFPGLGGKDIIPSTQRFFLELFPCFLILALYSENRKTHQTNERVHNTYLLLSLPMLGLLTLLFISGRWMV